MIKTVFILVGQGSRWRKATEQRKWRPPTRWTSVYNNSPRYILRI